ncbi:60S ribosomal protein L33B [Elasticomyces elasticus]|nr:60S ribosomal protein L33B [Elasticomyces elasticus]
MSSSTTGSGHRLYVKGKHLSYQRGKRNTNPGTSLIKIEGVDDPKAASFYLGKKIAFVYRGKREIRGTKIRVIWGKVTRPHGMWKQKDRDRQDQRTNIQDRQLRAGEGTVQAQPSTEVVRRDGAHHALPKLGMSNEQRNRTKLWRRDARCLRDGVSEGRAVADRHGMACWPYALCDA